MFLELRWPGWPWSEARRQAESAMSLTTDVLRRLRALERRVHALTSSNDKVAALAREVAAHYGCNLAQLRKGKGNGKGYAEARAAIAWKLSAEFGEGVAATFLGVREATIRQACKRHRHRMATFSAAYGGEKASF